MPDKVISEQDSSLYSDDLSKNEEECDLSQIDQHPAVSLNCKWLATKSAIKLKAFITYMVFRCTQLSMLKWFEVPCFSPIDEGGFFIGGRRYRWDSVRPPDVSHANLLNEKKVEC